MAKQDKTTKKVARRNARKQRIAKRKEKRSGLKALIADVSKLPDSDQAIDLAKDFNKYWPAVKAALQFAESLRLTGKRADRRLGAIVTAGDKLAADPNLAQNIDDFSAKMKAYWEKVRGVLIIATRFTPKKVDEVIDKIINIGDQFADYHPTT